MKHLIKTYGFSIILILVGCAEPPVSDPHGGHEMHEVAGEHGGRLLSKDDFAIEITIFETGVPPEFRVWPTAHGAPIDPAEVDLTISLIRLGGVTDKIHFVPTADYLRGDTEIYEPHSFEVEVAALYQGRFYQWVYESFEGRTRIAADLVASAGIATERAGPATVRDYVTVYGQVVSDPESVSHVVARFDGVLQTVNASIGDKVRKGQILAKVEANDSLNSYTVKSPIAGTVTERHANAGESTAGRTLFTIIDTRTIWAELAVFPSDRTRVSLGAPVKVQTSIGGIEGNGTIDLLSSVAGENQSVTARVRLANSDELLTAGMYLTGEIEVSQVEVPLAVRRQALQPFRDFTVVFARFGDEFEVRMLELGRQDDEWVEVLGGLRPGIHYVTVNSYVIKADIEKSGASHDH